MNRRYGEATREDPWQEPHGTVKIVSSGGGQVRIRKTSSRRLRELPELDLRTPSGRLLPF